MHFFGSELNRIYRFRTPSTESLFLQDSLRLMLRCSETVLRLPDLEISTRQPDVREMHICDHAVDIPCDERVSPSREHVDRFVNGVWHV